MAIGFVQGEPFALQGRDLLVELPQFLLSCGHFPARRTKYNTMPQHKTKYTHLSFCSRRSCHSSSVLTTELSLRRRQSALDKDGRDGWDEGICDKLK